MRHLTLLLFLLLGLSSVAWAASDKSPFVDPADPKAPPVTEANLMANEGFWPERVALAHDFTPPGRESPLPAGSIGALLRVEPGGRVRVDFGRDGFYDLPVADTDVVARANQVRLGELDKSLPVLVFQIGPRLLEPAEEQPRTVSPDVFARHRAFLCVFADLDAEGAGKLAAALAPLRERPGLLTIVFPQGRRPDPEVGERLRSLGWPVPFVFAHLSEPYTRILLPDDLKPPAALLLTVEGRVLQQASLASGVPPKLAQAVDAALKAPEGVASTAP